MTRKRFCASSSESEAVGSSRISTRRVGAERARDLDQLLLRACSASPASVSGSILRAHAREQLPARGCCASRQSTRRQDASGLEAERDVLRDGQLGKQRGLLVDGGDAERARQARRVVA